MKKKTSTKLNFKLSLMLLLLNAFAVANVFAQDIPLVFDVENRGADCTKPPLPGINDLPIVRPLPDPFEWSDGSGRDTTIESWSCRRNEIAAEIENYEIGPKPERPDTISAHFNYADSVLTVNITKNGQTMTLTSRITLPEGDGPFPAIIGMNSGTGSLPRDIFTSRKIATIAYMHNQVVTYNAKSINDPYFKLYPELIYSGEYAPWAWGVSRLIDGLELVQDSLPIDIKHLAVTGCSYAGKMALFCGAFDERIALTIAQESGGGGAAAWRVSETVGNVETLGATSHSWFMESMFKFAGSNTAKLPHDHHELMAMIAPRALFVLGNPDFEWLADESGYVSCRAAEKVWDNFGISDRFGFSIVGGHGHCQLPDSEKPEVAAFVDKFLLGDTTVNTIIRTNPKYADVNYSRWMDWWGTGDPVFPEQIYGVSKTYEAECASYGSSWIAESDVNASNGSYLVSKPGTSNTIKSAIDEASIIKIPVKIDTAGTYTVFGRLNCPTSNNDSFWARMDDGDFITKLSLGTKGWEWKKLGEYKLEKGDHEFSMAIREDGGQVDKVLVTSLIYYEPTGLLTDAENLCDPKVGINTFETVNGYVLGQNYPNPFNGKTNISFQIPANTYVSLKVYNMLGADITELAGKEFSKGRHILEFDGNDLAKGIYFYTIKADNFTETHKMVIGK